jgi:pSer/pThr/pTyr-binding forkhead associated (FHA) protein
MATLVYSDAAGVDRAFEVGGAPVMIGRSPECAIRSDDPLMSRMHARFYLDQVGNVYVEDLNSANGVYVGPHRVQHSVVPLGELVVVGSLMFRQLAPDGQAPLPAGIVGLLAKWLDLARKERMAMEQERNAYGERMAELHQEVRTLREQQLVQLAPGTAEHRINELEAEVDNYHQRLVDAEDLARDAKSRLASAEEELTVARSDVLAAEDRLVKELASRAEELDIARADLANAQNREMELSRKVAELEQLMSGRF